MSTVKNQNINETRRDLHVVHKVPSELVQLEQRTGYLATISQCIQIRYETDLWFPQFQIKRCQGSFKRLCYEQQRRNGEERRPVQHQGGVGNVSSEKVQSDPVPQVFWHT